MNEQELKTLNNLLTAAKILVLVSVFICGVPLDIAALICIYIASKRLKEISTQNSQNTQTTPNIQTTQNALGTQSTLMTPETQTLQLLQRSIRILTITCTIILVINIVSLYMMYPYHIEMINQIMSQNTPSSTSALSSSTAQGSIWG